MLTRNPKRIYASGCSNGGGMSYILTCKAADVIAAVAPVDFRCITGTEPASAGSLTPTNNTACTCTLPRPISVLAFDEGQAAAAPTRTPPALRLLP